MHLLKVVSVCTINTLTFFVILPSYAASFDCNKASTPTEHTICDYPELSALDELMDSAYHEKVSADWMTTEELKQTQREWMQVRDNCSDDGECLRAAYAFRLEEISSGVLSLSIRKNIATYVNEAQPVSGKCEAGTTLAEWGMCIRHFAGGPSFRAISTSGIMAFSFDYVGPNAHMCSLSGRADRVDDLWQYEEPETGCTLQIKINDSSLSLTPTEQCNQYCGMRAQGSLEQVIPF